jgi:hypothetical protein
MAKMGRPKIEIDWKVLEALCQVQCTYEEISAVLKVSIPTIQRRLKKEFNTTFEGYFKKHAANGKVSLRRAQFKAAMAGNTTMLVWLGKQNLGQRDQPIEAGEDDGAKPVPVAIVVEDASATTENHSE